MFDPHIQFDRRYAFYFDRKSNIHQFDACRLDRLQASKPDATLPEMAGQTVRFVLFHVERFTSPPRIVISEFPLLPLDANGRIDQQRYYDALQHEVDRLEANDYAVATPTQAEPSSTSTRHTVHSRSPLSGISPQILRVSPTPPT